MRAFQRDFEVNGPSVVRIARTMLAGWKRYKNHPDPRVRRRFAWEARDLPSVYSAVVAAARLYYRGNPAMRAKMDAILKDLHREFGLKSRFYAAVGGRYVLLEDAPRGEATRTGLDLRAADVLRAERSGPAAGLPRRPAGGALPAGDLPGVSAADHRGRRAAAGSGGRGVSGGAAGDFSSNAGRWRPTHRKWTREQAECCTNARKSCQSRHEGGLHSTCAGVEY